ncbi:MAG: PIN domain-containing protein [Pirellulales bacterium]
MKPVLLDSGPIVALLDRSEQSHRRCVEGFSVLDAPLVTCEAVIAEACYLLRKVDGGPEAVLENIAQGQFLVPYRINGREAPLTRLMTKYANVPMDLADACLVDMAGELGAARIFSLDDDFQIYRWGRNRPFEFILDDV